MEPEPELSAPEWVPCPNAGPAASSNAKAAAASRNQPQATRHASAFAGREGTVSPITGRGKLIVRSVRSLIPNYLATSSNTPTNIRGTLVQPVNTAIYSSRKLTIACASPVRCTQGALCPMQGCINATPRGPANPSPRGRYVQGCLRSGSPVRPYTTAASQNA